MTWYSVTKSIEKKEEGKDYNALENSKIDGSINKSNNEQ